MISSFLTSSNSHKFILFRGLDVIAAPKANILLLAGYLYGRAEDFDFPLWHSATHVVFVHPDLMQGPAGKACILIHSLVLISTFLID